MVIGRDYADTVDKWIQENFARGKFHLYIKTKHLKEDLHMKSGQVATGFRLLRSTRKTFYSIERLSGSLRVWNIVHPVIVVGKFLALFASKDGKQRLY